jgi:hypothetical protein
MSATPHTIFASNDEATLVFDIEVAGQDCNLHGISFLLAEGSRLDVVVFYIL